MYFITTKRMLEVCFSAHPNIQYRTFFFRKNLENECVIFYTVRQQMDGMEKNT